MQQFNKKRAKNFEVEESEPWISFVIFLNNHAKAI